jgi:hypothetical protein
MKKRLTYNEWAGSCLTHYLNVADFLGVEYLKDLDLDPGSFMGSYNMAGGAGHPGLINMDYKQCLEASDYVCSQDEGLCSTDEGQRESDRASSHSIESHEFPGHEKEPLGAGHSQAGADLKGIETLERMKESHAYITDEYLKRAELAIESTGRKLRRKQSNPIESTGRNLQRKQSNPVGCTGLCGHCFV